MTGKGRADYNSGMANADTPLMRQYAEVKSRHPDALLLFRLGDFYELFFDDAKKAAPILEIALTSRNKNDPSPVPMCGVPFHSAAGYVNRLVAAGHRVAICEQLEDPSTAKGIVRRDVVRIVSPGTQLDPDALEAKSANLTHAAVFAREGARERVLWAACDFTTGKFWFGTSESVAEWLGRALGQNPAEILLPDSDAGGRLREALLGAAPRAFAQTVPAFYFDLPYATERLREQFGAQRTDALHPNLGESARAAGALIKYFQETQRSPRIPSAERIDPWGMEGLMDLDEATLRSLEIFPRRGAGDRKDASLLSRIDRTRTAMGGRLLREWLSRPLTSVEAIRARQDEVARLVDGFTPIQAMLGEIYDIERLLARVSLAVASAGTSMANARDLRALAHSLLKGAELRLAVNPRVVELSKATLAALVDTPPLSTREGGLFQRGYRPELDELIDLSQNGEQWLAGFEARERKATGIGSLKVRFNRVFGYYIEVTKANLSSVPPHYVRKQTMVGGERFIIEELKAFEEKILTSATRRNELEFALFRELCTSFVALSTEVGDAARRIAHLDSVAALAAVAAEDGWSRPEIDDSGVLDIAEGWHPTVAAMLGRSTFVPNSVRLDGERHFLLVTGPNMGGKSTVMRQTALITLLAQIGSFVPANRARVGVTDRIFTRIGASDNIAEGASTFMVEMSEMSFILRHATARSLVLLDEVGRGTSTYDGMSLAMSLAEDIATRIRARTLFATHYHELTRLAELCPGVANTRMAVALGEGASDGGAIVRFLYRLEPGAAERSYGILVARLAGLPEPLLARAEAILRQLESSQPTQAEPGRRQARQEAAQPSSPLSPFPDSRQLVLDLSAPQTVARESAAETWLKTLEINRLTPLEALVQLAEWSQKVRDEQPVQTLASQ